MTPDEHRRRVDDVLEATFLEALDDVSPDDLRAKLRDARTEEDALSYIRRNLHGRLDLLRAEVELRRGGRGSDRSVEKLAAALTEGDGPGRGSRAGLGLRAAAVAGRRRAEQILSEDHLSRLPELSDGEIDEIIDRVAGAEERLSSKRHQLHDVIDALEAELARRYKAGLEPSLERLQ